jgi:hypothetical protein
MIAEDPVVVKPDAASKNAPAGVNPGGHSKYGSPPHALLKSHPNPTTTTASRRGIPWICCRTPPARIIPTANAAVIPPDLKSAAIASSSPATTSNRANNPQPHIASASNSKSIPVIRNTSP